MDDWQNFYFGNLISNDLARESFVFLCLFLCVCMYMFWLLRLFYIFKMISNFQ